MGENPDNSATKCGYCWDILLICGDINVACVLNTDGHQWKHLNYITIFTITNPLEFLAIHQWSCCLSMIVRCSPYNKVSKYFNTKYYCFIQLSCASSISKHCCRIDQYIKGFQTKKTVFGHPYYLPETFGVWWWCVLICEF